MFNEDNNGYVFFPLNGGKLTVDTDSKTLIYLVAFEVRSFTDISNVNLQLTGEFVSDDVVDRYDYDDVAKNHIFNSRYDGKYFPNLQSDDINLHGKSINLTSVICIGWSNNTYEIAGVPWKATYNDLSDDGQKLYYTLKKLHNNKEIRILTFNNI